MSHFFSLESNPARLDAIQFLQRAARVNDGSARLIADGTYLQVYVGVLFPRGLLDRTPTVLGLRVFGLAEPVTFDVVVPIESLVHRLTVGSEQGETANRVPAEVASLQWAAITRPKMAGAVALPSALKPSARLPRLVLRKSLKLCLTRLGNLCCRRFGQRSGAA